MFEMPNHCEALKSLVNRSRVLLVLFVVAMTLLVSAPTTLAQTTNFTYQGRLTDAGVSASGAYDFEFKLYDAAGAQVGTTLTREDVPMTNGVFSVELDFGVSPFATATAHTLEIGVRPGASTGAFTTLTPRQPITSTPYAIKTLSAEQLGGVAADQYVQTNDPRLSDARPPAPGNSNYIQNQSATAQSADFKISGDGTAAGTLSGNVVNAATQYDLGGNRLISAAGGGVGNLFLGFSTGLNTTPGSPNFFSGKFNSFVGDSAGRNNTTGSDNSFAGHGAGRHNTDGSRNTFFGSSAGQENVIGNNNAFFGSAAGLNTTGDLNAFFGTGAGQVNTAGSSITLVGAFANVTANNLTNATAIGAGAVVSASNSLVLGNNVNVGIGTANPNFRLDVQGDDVFGNTTARILSSRQAAILSLDSTIGGQNQIWNVESGILGNPGLFGILNRNTLQAKLTINPSGQVSIPGNLDVGQTLNTNTLTGNFTIPTSRITGTLGVGNGGTGLGSAGAAGNFLRSDGAVWTSSPIQPSDIPNLSSTFIQNTTTLQSASNFNISGSGTADTFNAQTWFSIRGDPILSNMGQNNMFAGVGAGRGSSGSSDNAFFGFNAGLLNNGFSSSNNSYFGSRAGRNNLSGSNNTFIGALAGSEGFGGFHNSFLGYAAGIRNFGSGNSFFGSIAGSANTFGSGNSFFGDFAGSVNTSGDLNTFIGHNAQPATGDLTNATAIGAQAIVSASNSLVLGRNANVGIGTSAPGSKLTVVGLIESTTGGIKFPDGTVQTTANGGAANAILNQTTQQQGANFNISGNGTLGGTLSAGNVGIGTTTPQTRLHIEGAGIVESMVRSTNERAILVLDSRAGGQRRVWTLESGVFGNPGLFGIYDRNAGQARLLIGQNGNVGIGTSFLGSKLTVDGGIWALGNVRFNSLAVQGTVPLCRSGSGFIAFCSSSLRYKTDLRPFSEGLNAINKLRPISFKWKSDAALDVGFGAEDVAKVNPLFVTYNDKGEVEGVKYDRLSVVFVNAIREQQGQIERQQQQIEALKKLICRAYPAAEVCKQ